MGTPDDAPEVRARALLARLGFELGRLDELAAAHAELWALEDEARSRRADATLIAETKRRIDAANARRHALIAEFDAAAATAAEGVRYSETPGELCDRLIILGLKCLHTDLLAADATLPADERRRCGEKAAALHRWRAYLTECLLSQAEDLEAGRAVLPPRAEFKLYNERLLNPVTRKEG